MSISNIPFHLSVLQTAFDNLMAENTALRACITELETQLAAHEKPALLLPSQLVAPVVPVVPVVPVAPEAKKAAGRPKKVTLPFPALPAAGSEAPGPEAYRLAAADIKLDVCVGRILTEATKDKRWSVAIYPEAQCGAAVADGSDLCAGCRAKEARYLAEGAKYDRWTGRITEEPLPWVHMLGTAWAAAGLASGRLRWVGEVAAVGGAGTDTASDSGSVSSAASAAKAEREAFKAAKAEAKAIEKAAKAEAKAVAKAAKAEAKAAAKAAKAAKVPPAVGPVDGYPTEVAGKLYWQSGNNLYEYNMETEHGGKYVGVLLSDGVTIVRKV